MKKKNGVNIMHFVFIIIFIGILSCSENLIKVPEGSLLETDRRFSAMSLEEGMFEAFLYYIDDEGVILRDNAYPSEGRNSLIEYFEGKTDTTFVLSWEPLKEKIAASGDLGYTYGIHTNRNKLTGEEKKGTYVTIWHRKPDGNWKFVLDTGTQGLPVFSE